MHSDTGNVVYMLLQSRSWIARGEVVFWAFSYLARMCSCWIASSKIISLVPMHSPSIALKVYSLLNWLHRFSIHQSHWVSQTALEIHRPTVRLPYWKWSCPWRMHRYMLWQQHFSMQQMAHWVHLYFKRTIICNSEYRSCKNYLTISRQCHTHLTILIKFWALIKHGRPFQQSKVSLFTLNTFISVQSELRKRYLI